MNEIIKKILVTCALPYANGPIHLGHMLEHIQADIWVRYKRMRGNKVYFICADDAHGTPIMLKAQQLGVSPQKMIKKINIEHQIDFSGFNISYDNYYTTHSDENYKFLILIYQRLKNSGFIKSHFISQFFDLEKCIFLPDRFVKGKCPKCFVKDQYGDNCENCGATYNQVDLINPKSVISGSTPIIREVEHFFFDLPVFSNMLYDWINSGVLQDQILNKMQEWFKTGLQQWDISRNAPYFGFEIPDAPGKYFYVWLDAPIGYISSFENFCKKRTEICFDDFWNIDSQVDLCHFIGKDIIYFHSLFWPAILHGSNFRKPTNIFVHGYVMVNGNKMSKSRGTFIKASTYLSYLDADCLRYYYASKMSSGINDIDFNLKDFIQRVNSDIVNKIVNIASRNAKFINKIFNGKLSSTISEPDLYATFVNAATFIGELFSNRDTKKAICEIMFLANLANKYIDDKAPWVIAKTAGREIDLQNICSMGIRFFMILMVYLKPILPSLAKRAEDFLAVSLTWELISIPLLSHRINSFKTLFSRIRSSQVEDMINSSSNY